VSKKKALPSTICVVRKQGDKSDWLEAQESVEDFAEIGRTVKVGIYQLINISKVTAIVEVED